MPGRGTLPLSHFAAHRVVHGYLTQHALQRFQRQAARAQQAGRLYRQIDDGTLHPHGAGAAVHDAVYLARHIVHHVLSGGGAGRPDVLPLGAAMGAAPRLMASVTDGWAADAHRLGPPVVRRGTISRRGRIMIMATGILPPADKRRQAHFGSTAPASPPREHG